MKISMKKTNSAEKKKEKGQTDSLKGKLYGIAIHLSQRNI